MATKLGMCGCEYGPCAAGIRLDSENFEVPDTEHECGGCPSEALIEIRIFGHRQSLCADCYAVTVGMSDVNYEILTDLRRRS